MHFGENQLSPLSIGISPLPTVHPSGLQSTPVRPSTSCYGRFSLTMGSSSGFGSTRRDERAFHTRFRCGSACNWLNRATTGNSPDHTPKGTPSAHVLPHLGLRLHVSIRFQGLFHSPRRGTFHRSLTVLCAIGRCVYVALGGGPPSFTPRCTCAVLLKDNRPAGDGRGLPGCHGLWRRFPDVFETHVIAGVWRQPHNRLPCNPVDARPAGLARPRFGPFPVRSPLLREYSLFLGVREMFQFPRCPPSRGW
jgi:hypothetical protein